jgi:hypothetical protein
VPSVLPLAIAAVLTVTWPQRAQPGATAPVPHRAAPTTVGTPWLPEPQFSGYAARIDNVGQAALAVDSGRFIYTPGQGLRPLDAHADPASSWSPPARRGTPTRPGRALTR